jgi:hypothetical protein
MFRAFTRRISTYPVSSTRFRVVVPVDIEGFQRYTPGINRKHLIHQRFFERVVYPLQMYPRTSSTSSISSVHLDSTLFDGMKHEYTFIVKQPEEMSAALQQFEHIIQDIKSTINK